MEQRNFLKAQMDQVGRALARIITEFFGLVPDDELEPAIAKTNESLMRELNLDLDQLIRLNPSERKEYLAERSLAPEHLTPLTNYMITLGEYYRPVDPPRANQLFQCVLQLYEWTDESTNLYSLERFSQEEKIKQYLRPQGER